MERLRVSDPGLTICYVSRFREALDPRVIPNAAKSVSLRLSSGREAHENPVFQTGSITMNSGLTYSPRSLSMLYMKILDYTRGARVAPCGSCVEEFKK